MARPLISSATAYDRALHAVVAWFDVDHDRGKNNGVVLSRLNFTLAIARVYCINPKVVERAIEWLIKQAYLLEVRHGYKKTKVLVADTRFYPEFVRTIRHLYGWKAESRPWA